MRPGINITTREEAPTSTIPTDVGTGFMIGVTEAGPQQVSSSDVVQNMDGYRDKYAPSGRTFAAGAMAYDSAEVFFREGGNRLYVGRVVGPGAVAATKPIPGGTGTTFTATARSVGEWGNNIDVVVRTSVQDPAIPAGSYRLRIVNHATTEVLEESYDLLDKAAGLAWAQGSSYISLTSGVDTTDPVAATISLTGGTSDAAAVTDVQWQTGLDSLGSELGPGIVFGPGATTDTLHVKIAQHALDKTRVAFLDGANTATASTLKASAAAVVDSTLKRSRFAAVFAPWLVIPGITVNTTRTVPPSPAVAGLFCRNVAGGLSPNEPSAGDNGIFRTALDVSQVYTDAQRQDLNNNGVDIIIDQYNVRKVYGWRTVADPINDAKWTNLGNSILHRGIAAQAGAVGERFIFKEIDGQGRLLSSFAGALIGQVCMPLFLEGSLYGQSPQEAFKVDVGPSVNTDATIANGELHAVISVRMSQFGEEVTIEIVKYLVTDLIPA